ncbi:MAG TPA: hypothetical protein VFC96_04630 [Anaerovoracaceae bacterium]|nr:hypothetical protein [Anaerovoracaceae bacterium]
MEKKSKLICNKCKVDLTLADVHFSYLNHNFRHKVLRCPRCGQVHLSEELVGRIKEVETAFEDK